MGQIDLNADVGEGLPLDAELLSVVTSANIACGGHAGDAATMRLALAAARQNRVVVGAHPGWPDRPHFGRVRMTLPLAQLQATLDAQLAALQAAAHERQWPVRYVKLHGALANQAAEDPELAREVALWLRGKRLGWLVMAQTEMQTAARDHGVPHHTEAFADRAYAPTGLLVARGEPGAVLDHSDAIAERAVAMLQRQALPLADGNWLPSRIDSLCVHGDTPGALAHARTLRARLERAGWMLLPLPW